MGTEITLDVGGISLTYSKNHRGMDHESLYQEADRNPIRSDQLDYDYYEREGEDPTPFEMTFTRPLKDVVPRLELLGFNLDRVRREYDSVAESWLEEQRSTLDDDPRTLPELMSFEEFRLFAVGYPIESLDNTFALDTDRGGEEKIQGRFAGMAFDRIPTYDPYDIHAYSERSFFGELVNILHPYSVMRLLAENKSNNSAAVDWQYGLLVEAGWATEAEFFPTPGGARRS